MNKIPSIKELDLLMDDVKALVFPEHSYTDSGTALCNIRNIFGENAGQTALEAFMEGLEEIKRLCRGDARAILSNDPASADLDEVIHCYPGLTATLHYRVAHVLHKAGVKVLPRMLTERAHSLTGIDIHPGATIGENFAIDHGTGIVIGATSIIGNNVMIYQGVTLGARNFKYDESGNPLDYPRHPVIEDNVTIYSNATVLGRVTIGHHSIIGGNVWLTHDVPPFSRIVQSKAVSAPLFSEGAGI